MRHIKEFNQLFENTQELTQEQKDWLDKCSTKGTWKLNPQTGLVDVVGNFDCKDQNLTDFKGVRFGSVSGHFNCSNNQLTSLEEAPKSVGLNFDCPNNRLTSLEGAPQRVGLGFDCSNNRLTSLEGAPQSVANSFYCLKNQLTSLEGAPPSVGGYFNCTNNRLTSLKGAPKSVGLGFDCSNNNLTSLEGAPQKLEYTSFLHCSDNPISEKSIKGVLRRMSKKAISLEQAVAEYWKFITKDDRPYLAKHHPDLSPEEKRGYLALERLKTRLI